LKSLLETAAAILVLAHQLRQHQQSQKKVKNLSIFVKNNTEDAFQI